MINTYRSFSNADELSYDIHGKAHDLSEDYSATFNLLSKEIISIGCSLRTGIYLTYNEEDFEYYLSDVRGNVHDGLDETIWVRNDTHRLVSWSDTALFYSDFTGWLELSQKKASGMIDTLALVIPGCGFPYEILLFGWVAMTKKDIKLYEKLVKITQDFEALIKEEDDKVIQPHFNEFELCSADVREALKLLNDAGFKVVKES